ncbi:acetyl esterase [Gordonia malaquae]|uniref:Putative esterase n=1 Tax=Gordonia malaquae NBRC 108250 TaxID=1223542 RepID=M3VBW1_GORML|nr:alpha/beta hydrolase [Gordonia malaquae]GAC80953.1 putative esterase [Gordonia malaquae NBRC 108250]SED72463.1 acetyl esterase [Gordonia malaquae]
MPVDPKTQAFLTATENGRGLHEMPLDQARTAFDKLSIRSGIAPVEVADVVERTIPGPAGDIAVRVYTPEGEGPFPVVIFFPGGGFVVGNPSTVHGPVSVLCKQIGAVVVSVDYRKGPEDPFPAAVDDAIAVTRWVGDHAAELDGDASRIAVAGDSAGGNLATVVAIDARDNGGPALAAQVLIYPATDISKPYPSLRENGRGFFITVDVLRWFGEGYRADPLDWRASPMLVEDLSGLPPAFVVTAEFDPLRDQGEVYAHRLADAGVDVQARRYDGQIHGFVANLAAVTGLGATAINDIGEFLDGVFTDD